MLVYPLHLYKLPAWNSRRNLGRWNIINYFIFSIYCILVIVLSLPYITITNLRKVAFIVITITSGKTKTQRRSLSLSNQQLLPTRLKEEKEEGEDEEKGEEEKKVKMQKS